MALVATIFLPLGFMTTVFGRLVCVARRLFRTVTSSVDPGMNFVDTRCEDLDPQCPLVSSMPLLMWDWGYEVFWVASLLVAVGLMWLFHKWGYSSHTGMSTRTIGKLTLFGFMVWAAIEYLSLGEDFLP